jgi:hypothetical protein
MRLSDTTNKNGLIQECEFWTNLGDGTISGDTTLLKVFVNRLNRSYDRVMPLLLSYSDTMKWDDSANHTKHPIGYFDIESGVGDYEFLADEQGNSILNIVALSILQSASATEYAELGRLTLDDPRAERAMSPNPSDTGVPSRFLERNNTVFFDVVPNYNATNGGKLFFERSPSYFSASTLTKTPGIPEPFQALLAQEASKDWLAVHKSEQVGLLTTLQNQIVQSRADIKLLIDKKHPTRRRAVGATKSHV